MPHSTLKKARCVTAYIAGGVLTFFGVMWFLVQVGTQIRLSTLRPFSAHFSGYALAAVLAACGVLICLAALRGMPDSTLRKVTRITAYAVGGVLSVLGVIGFLIELGKGMPSSKHFSDYVIAFVLFSCGVLTCVAVRLQYGGGLLSLLGLLLVASGPIRLGSVLQSEMQGRHLISPVVFYFKTAALCGVGLYCLSWGHLRRHGEKKKDVNEAG